VNGAIRLDAAFRRALDAASSELDSPRFISCVGGNTHNALSLLRFARPFDFVLSDQPELPLDDSAEIVPEGAIAETIAMKARGSTNLLKCLALELDVRIVHVESPPPIGDDRYCIAALDTMFRKEIGDRGIAPPMLRYKMWRLHSRIFKDVCNESGLQFLPAPAGAMDENGFLVRECYGSATHANSRYGELVIQQLETM
jgi:hypothetical protein